jgi:hypothetical protein
LTLRKPKSTNTTRSGMQETIAVANKLPPTALVSGWNGVIFDLLSSRGLTGRETKSDAPAWAKGICRRLARQAIL